MIDYEARVAARRLRTEIDNHRMWMNMYRKHMHMWYETAESLATTFYINSALISAGRARDNMAERMQKLEALLYPEGRQLTLDFD